MLFGWIIFLSAFLLFQVQLIVSKHLLPWFGGTPAVWTTSQMFFQVLLLGGYTYAHVLTKARRPWLQFQIHLGMLLAAAVAVVAVAVSGGQPLLAPAWMKPAGTENPVSLLLRILIVTVGLPFFVVSTTGPLLQKWHSRQSTSLTRTYRLYALSNAGSFLALLSYPFGVERLLDLPRQAWVWGLLFLVFAIGCGVIAWRAAQHPEAVQALFGRVGVSRCNTRWLAGAGFRLAGRPDFPPFTTGDRWLFASVVTIAMVLALRYLIERTRFGHIGWVAPQDWTVTLNLTTTAAKRGS